MSKEDLARAINTVLKKRKRNADPVRVLRSKLLKTETRDYGGGLPLQFQATYLVLDAVSPESDDYIDSVRLEDRWRYRENFVVYPVVICKQAGKIVAYPEFENLEDHRYQTEAEAIMDYATRGLE